MDDDKKGTTMMTLDQQAQVSVVVQQGAMALAERMNLVRHVISQMEEGTHYGASFPGDKKKNLLKPGADYLGVAFRLVNEFDVERVDLPNGHREYSVNCKVSSQADGRLIANGIGSCSTMETKYRYRFAKRKCPACQSEALIQTKTGRNPGGYWCVPDRGGCGQNFNPGDPEVENQERGKIENPDPADQYNTCMKIAKKRAMVDAMIAATGCSDQFTQDAEDFADAAPAPAPRTAAPATPAPAPAAPPAQRPAPAAPMTPPAQSTAPRTAPRDDAPPDPAALEQLLRASSNATALQATWKNVVDIQSSLQSADLVRLGKVRRDMESHFAKTGDLGGGAA